MANTFTLTMTNITLSAISIELGSAASVALTTAMIKIRKFNAGSFEDFTTFTVSGATTTAATINPDTAFGQSDLILIQIQDGTDYSDRVMVDFAEDYDAANHDATYKYELPAQVGCYKMELDKVNGSDFSTVQSSTFNVGDEPAAVDCSISIAKDYLVKYTGEVIDLTVVLDNTGVGKEVTAGNYEVSIDADLQ